MIEDSAPTRQEILVIATNSLMVRVIMTACLSIVILITMGVEVIFAMLTKLAIHLCLIMVFEIKIVISKRIVAMMLQIVRHVQLIVLYSNNSIMSVMKTAILRNVFGTVDTVRIVILDAGILCFRMMYVNKNAITYIAPTIIKYAFT